MGLPSLLARPLAIDLSRGSRPSDGDFKAGRNYALRHLARCLWGRGHARALLDATAKLCLGPGERTIGIRANADTPRAQTATNSGRKDRAFADQASISYPSRTVMREMIFADTSEGVRAVGAPFAMQREDFIQHPHHQGQTGLFRCSIRPAQSLP